jgi:glycosyltransferase involved in cell wall biosynthesis
MKQDDARVTIGVPVYNGGTMFADMLDSLLRQTYQRFEIVISDNASTDDTGEIARSFAARDPRIRYSRNETNVGAAPNYNRVFQLADRTPYFKWAAHDDLYGATYLEKCVAALDADPGVVLAHTIVDVVDETGQGSIQEHASYRRGVVESYTDSQGRPGWMMGPLHLAEQADPARRFSELLNQMIACFPIFGVIRSEALRCTALHQSYYGSDRSLLAQLVLMGRFHQVPERLYTNRYHGSASRALSPRQQKVWIDAKRGSRYPLLRQKWDILRAPFIAELDAADRARCLGVALQHFTRRQAGRLLKPVLRAASGRRAGGGLAP